MLVYFYFGKRQRPTLPARLHASTIGPEELNFCVRYENRWTPSALSPLWYNNKISLGIIYK